MSDALFFNGINGSTGEYLLPSIPPETLAAAIKGQQRNPAEEQALRSWWRKYAETNPQKEGHYMAKEGTDYKDLSSAGWGVIFPFNMDEAIFKALRPLLDWRKSQAGLRYREYRGPQGYRFKPGEMYEDKEEWLTRHGAGPGPADPDVVPYYLLIVGDPDQVPYSFQTQLDVAYAVGRIHFDKVEDYWNYANSVVSAEKQNLSLGKTAAFFGVCNPDDPATNMSTQDLIAPLTTKLKEQQKDWDISTTTGGQATKASLGRLLGGDDTPALLFSASHGMGFDNGDARQLTDQGALLCQDWPGPVQWKHKPVGQDFYFAGSDLDSNASLFGLVAFFFACYGAGTPKMDDFSRQALKAPSQIAPKDFLAALPKRMLAHPKGGALAVIGHVERAWGCSFSWGEAGSQVTVFQSALKRLMDGFPIGYAFEYFNGRYSELASDLATAIEDAEFGRKRPPAQMAGMWTARNDARNYVVLGDPFVRLMA